MNQSIGIIIIGRNEGERLKRCFESIFRTSENIILPLKNIIYVDSGSTDESVSHAKSIGISVVALDMSIPFSASRGRNTGFNYLIEINPEVNYVQFIDGDCQLIDGWLHAAVKFLDSNKSYAIVCGRLKEQRPNASIYNQLCDIEWKGSTGDIDYCGGIFMIRAKAYKDANGMNPSIIAGEEPEFCIRLRLKEWKIFRIEHDMAWHDAGMTKFSQWWKRAKRTGFSYATGASIHGRTRFRHNVKEKRSSLFWGLLIPLIILITALSIDLKAFFIILIYPLLILRLYIRLYIQNRDSFNSLLYALNCILAKFPESIGILKFQFNKFFKRENRIIEYK
jgi:glycosyltransferase involved in cell wall biosynthesis